MRGRVKKSPAKFEFSSVAKTGTAFCATLDTRDSPQDVPVLFGMSKSAAHRNRACDTLHLGWAMRAGTAKRSRLILLK